MTDNLSNISTSNQQQDSCTSSTNDRGTLYVFSGPSGVGKGTLLSKVLKRRENIWQSVSATTRPPRKGEVCGTSYYFMDKDDFLKDVENGRFLEWAEYAGNYYGTPSKYVLEHLNSGEDVFLEIDVQGAMQVKESMPECVLVFITPPSIEELFKRLKGRSTESIDALNRRMEIAEMELSHKKEYDVEFVNDIVEDAVNKICNLIDSRRENIR